MTFTLNYIEAVRPSSDISDSTYPRSKQAHITLFTKYDYKSHIRSATNNVLPPEALHLQ